MKTYELVTTNGHLLQVRAEIYAKHSDLLVFYDALGEVDRFPTSYIVRVNESAVLWQHTFLPSTRPPDDATADVRDHIRREA